MELGKVDLIQDTVQSLVENKDNNSSSSCITPAEMAFNTEKRNVKLVNKDITRKSVQSLLCHVENEGNHTNQFSPSICMAPDVLRDLSPSSFNPRVVSIGPLHRDDKNVQAFEGCKARYLNKLLSRIRVPKEEILESCIQKVYTSMEQIKACYVWTKTYGDAEIAEMMVMDACFILEFIYHLYWTTGESYSGNKLQAQNVKCDLVLLENQIPFFILDQIFQCTILKFNPNISLIWLLRPLLSYHNLFEADIKINHISVNTTLHILSLLHECYKPSSYISSETSVSSTIPCAVDLDRAGINFKPNLNPTWPLQMEVDLYRFIPCFYGSWSKPTLRMPVLKIHDYTEFVLRNLIAYEHSCQTCNQFTSFAIAINRLVDTEEDVAKLVDSRVLVNIVGSNEEAANMINNICKEVAWVDFYYEQQWVTLNEYCNGYWSKQIARLRRTYFSSPWNMIALLAGIILFSLTMVQTFFTIKPIGSNN